MKKIIIPLVLGLLFLAGCGESAANEKQRFTDASIETACEIVKDPTLYNDVEASKQLAIDVFKKYDFDMNDAAVMQDLSDKYQTDDSVVQALQEGITKCAAAVKSN